MAGRSIRLAAILGVTLAIAGLAYLQGYSDRENGTWFGLIPTAMAKGKPKISPTGKLMDPNVYFPGTEELAPDEMRVVACGTGMPTARESQAATCWLVELGNGDKFIFDGGTGSGARIASMHIPYDYLNKIFLSHLHTDHFGDFSAYFIGGWVAGRQGPLHVYGPSGDRPETGTKYAIEHWQKAIDLGHRGSRRPSARFRRKGRRPRVRLQGRERGRLPGERRHHPLVAGQPRHRWAGQFPVGVERPQASSSVATRIRTSGT